eukprot:5643895-Amphidinium_carterae.1
MPELLRALHQLARTRTGEMALPYLAITVNAGVAPWHQDGNAGDSTVVAFGPFTGGRLRVCAPGGQVGTYGIRHQWLRFDGRCPHTVTTYRGQRVSVSFYLPRHFDRAEEHFGVLREQGFPVSACLRVGDKAEAYPAEVQRQEADAYQRTGRMELLNPSARLPEIETWSDVPSQLKRELLRMHCNLGHLDCAQMMRMLTKAGAKKEVVRLCSLLECSTCGDLLRRRFPKAVKLGVNEYCFGLRLAVDVLSIKDAENQPHRFLNILDLGTQYQVCAYLAPGVGVSPAQLVLRTSAVAQQMAARTAAREAFVRLDAD